jgi:translation initiation factor eIF-2B subunit delta
MAEQIPLSSDDSPKNQPQSGVKKEPKQQQQQQQQHKQQQKGRVDLKGVISSQTGRPTATGSAGQHSKNENDKGQKSQHPKNEQKPQVNPAGVKGQQTTKASVVMPARLSLFDHLPRKQSVANPFSIEGDASLHPATIKLGLLYRKGSVQSDDDRIVALLATFLNVIKDYKTPPNKNLSWDLDRHIRTQVQYLVDCRQLSMGMGNLIKYIRYEISHIAPELSEADAKAYLIEKLTIFLEERVVYARELITMCCVNTIKDDDVILTFGSSALIRQILLKAAVTKRFRLIVVDTRPLNEGLLTLG